MGLLGKISRVFKIKSEIYKKNLKSIQIDVNVIFPDFCM